MLLSTVGAGHDVGVGWTMMELRHVHGSSTADVAASSVVVGGKLSASALLVGTKSSSLGGEVGEVIGRTIVVHGDEVIVGGDNCAGTVDIGAGQEMLHASPDGS